MNQTITLPVFLEMYYEYVLAEWDPHREYLKRYGYALYFKHELARMANPKLIVELGVRAGYAMWSMLMGAIDASYIGFDTWAPLLEGGDGTEENPGRDYSEQYYARAVCMADLVGHERVQLRTGDTQVSGFSVPGADLYHVDAAHDEAGCYRDVLNCVAAAGPQSVICVHDWNDAAIRKAVRVVIKEHKLQHYVVSNEWGDVLLTKNEMPQWVADLQSRRGEWWDPHSLTLAIQLTQLAREEFEQGMLDAQREMIEYAAEHYQPVKSLAQELSRKKTGQVVTISVRPSEVETQPMETPGGMDE